MSFVMYYTCTRSLLGCKGIVKMEVRFLLWPLPFFEFFGVLLETRAFVWWRTVFVDFREKRDGWVVVGEAESQDGADGLGCERGLL